MSIQVQCAQCGARFAAAPHLFGRRVACTQCGGPIDVPTPNTDPFGNTMPLAPPMPAYSFPQTAATPRKKSSTGRTLLIVAGVVCGGVGLLFVLCIALAFVALRSNDPTAVGNVETASLADARRGFQTRLVRREALREPLAVPPPREAQVVRFDSTVGKLGAYVTPIPTDGKRHPAIVWITGGDCNSIDDGVFQPAPPDNDQTAAAFRQAGIVMMYPSLRGGSDNPGFKEGFFGEVDDAIAAAEHLARQNGIDPQRIYLGGHSTGGTLALLTAETTDRFRAVFSFGPVDDITGYGPDFLFFDTNNRRELELRQPIRWLHSVRRPTFVIEGARRGNIRCLQNLERANRNPLVKTITIRRADHFSLLAPVTRLLASKIVADTGPTSNIAITEDELNALVR